MSGPRIAQGCATPAKKMKRLRGIRVCGVIGRAVVSRDNGEANERGGCVTPAIPEFERTIARQPQPPRAQVTGNYPATEVRRATCVASFILRAFLSFVVFFPLRGLINLVPRLIA